MTGVTGPLTERQKAEFSEDSIILEDYAVTYDSIHVFFRGVDFFL